ncbi:MAG: methyltransferase domain-containing protein, partial [Lewinella sp.]
MYHPRLRIAMNNWNFFREALKNFRSTGAIARASPALIKHLIGSIPSDRPLTVVELGPGEGCVTRALLDTLHPNSTLTAFEINPAFVRRLQVIQDPRLRIIASGADRVTDHFGPATVDYVVSSLPLSMIDQPVKQRIIQQSQKVLTPAGEFLQYQYALQDYG